MGRIGVVGEGLSSEEDGWGADWGSDWEDMVGLEWDGESWGRLVSWEFDKWDGCRGGTSWECGCKSPEDCWWWMMMLMDKHLYIWLLDA